MKTGLSNPRTCRITELASVMCVGYTGHVRYSDGDGDVMARTRDLPGQQLDLCVLMLSYFWMGFKCLVAIRNLTTGQPKK